MLSEDEDIQQAIAMSLAEEEMRKKHGNFNLISPERKRDRKSSSFEDCSNNGWFLLIFGSSPDPADLVNWQSHSFHFSEVDGFSFALSQSLGGPCGVLAPLQALILKDLIFVKPKHTLCQLPKPQHEESLSALLDALAFTIDRCRYDDIEEIGPIVIVTLEGASESLSDMQVSSTSVQSMFAYKEILSKRFSDLIDSPLAILQYVLSLVLTRGGIDAVKSDMDDPSCPLIGKFGHCSQELVNLMLTGRATSNVFDGTQSLGEGMILRGIDVDKVAPVPVGYLTELEALRYVTVGNCLKFPSLPLWLVGSATHYTVLFGLKASDASLSIESEVTNKVRSIFNAHALIDGVIEQDKLPLVLKLMNFPSGSDIRSEGGIVLLGDFIEWARRRQLIPSNEKPCNDVLQLYHLNGQEPVTLSRVLVYQATDIDPSMAQVDASVASCFEESSSVLGSTLQTRWVGSRVSITPIHNPSGSG